MAKAKVVYSCQKCGAQRSRWEGKCSDCGAWNSFVEETYQSTASAGNIGFGFSATALTGKSTSVPTVISLDQNVVDITPTRMISGISEFDRVVGNGIVEGSLTLLGGEPGIGKSTLILQVAAALAEKNYSVLYISGEESVQQTALRAQRMGLRQKNVKMATESSLEVILQIAEKEKPDFLIIDSIQTVFSSQIESAPGTVSQVRDCAGRLMVFAKSKNISVLLIGHVNKDGAIAGPKVLEHMVDTVLSFEGDPHYHFRLLRTLKNRFGPAFEMGVFQMTSKGLEEVLNPSEFFLEERQHSVVGSSVFASVEGSRPLLCEIQALTVSTPMPMARRTTVGCDASRLHLLLAVLDKHLNVSFMQMDVFLNVVGGLKIQEPSVDLAIIASLLSSHQNSPVPSDRIYFGEVGLTGEVRAATFPDQRIKEALRLGFKSFCLPKSNKRHLKDFLATNPGLNLIYVENVRDLRGQLGKAAKSNNFTATV